MTWLGMWLNRFRRQSDAQFTDVEGGTIATRIAIDCYTTLQGRFACNFTLESDSTWHVYLIVLDNAPTKPFILSHPEMWHLVRSFPRPLAPPP